MWRRYVLALGLLSSSSVFAMQALEDQEMASVSGAGIGFFADQFLYDQSGASARIGGLRDSQNRELTIELENLYIKGKGSQRGSVDRLAQIGSPMHPFTLHLVGQQQATSLPAGKTALQLEFPTYNDPLNNTRQYGIWSLYQGCLLGTAGCTDASRAVTRVNEEIARLNQTRTTLSNRYNGQFVNLKTGIDIDLVATRSAQLAVDNKLVEVQAARVLAQQREQAFTQAQATRQSTWNAAPASYWEGILLVTKPLSIGSKYYCGIDGYCENAQARAYNAAVDAYNSAETARNNAQSALQARTNELLPLQTALGNAWRVTRNGVELHQRVNDYETFAGLCGTPTQNQPSCVGGSIAKVEQDKVVVQMVVTALQQGGTRVEGVDIGMKTRFSLPSTAYTSSGRGATTTRTDYFSIDIENLSLNNSFLNIWGDNGKLSFETSLKLYADRLVLGACRTCTDANRLVASNVYMDINLGHGTYQPMTLGSLANGELELRLPAVTYANHVNFYRYVPKSTVSVGNLKFGNTDIGAQSIRGIRVDYLNVTTVKLPR